MYLQPGVVVRQSSNSSSLLPYRKRYSVLYPHAPIHLSRNVDSKIMPVSGNEEPGVVARQYSNTILPYKKRYSLLYPHVIIHPSRNVDDLVKPSLAEKLAGQEVVVNPSLLSPSLNNNDADDTACTNRFNWDLNIPMDLWEASDDDLVTSGEGSRNDRENISTEEECYASDAFAGRVDTNNVGCAREDDIYEDEKGCSMPLHTHESHDDFMKACDDKAKEILHNFAVFKPTTGSSLPSRMEERGILIWKRRNSIYKGREMKFMVMVPNLLEIGFRTIHLVGEGGTSCMEEIGDGDGARAASTCMSTVPSGREDVAMMGTQILRRAPRNTSPRKCTGEDGFASRTWSLPPRRLTEGLDGCQDLSQRRRSPPDQVFTRTNRPRFEISDHHERADSVGYFDGPIHTGRCPEHHSSERSKYDERQGGPRKMRNVKEQEGGNLRLRHADEFDGFRLKKRRF
ncbi:hypothetical protein MTR67_018539 [Solanum verrucosum]|uniref:Uncharacterized protein n=1 Tax=Solanum verrucosum TaxID=315347 RepID=A0AAF0QJV8_SOLVR|nr:hypothetical protein MTR67_018539 [Solanum verrucosum]